MTSSSFVDFESLDLFPSAVHSRVLSVFTSCSTISFFVFSFVNFPVTLQSKLSSSLSSILQQIISHNNKKTTSIQESEDFYPDASSVTGRAIQQEILSKSLLD